MPRFRLPVFAIPALALFLVLGDLAAESARNYRMYRNPPKARLAIAPVAGPGIAIEVRKAFDAALDREARKLKGFQVVPFPKDAAPDSQGLLAPAGLGALRGHARIDLLLQGLVETEGDRLALYVEILDTRTGETRADSKEECRCPQADFLATGLPAAVRRLGNAPRMKAMRCPQGMASLPGPGSIAPKGDSASADLGPGAFCMDLYEYPNQSAGEPVVEKTWEQASEACAKAGKRLCTEAEWELACGGFGGEAYPYGAGYEETRCNTNSLTIQLSGGNAGCKSPFGLFDLSGNVYEWTSSEWSAKYDHKVVKGGNWSSAAENSTCKARFGQPPSTVSKAIGFRCCMSLGR
jgi:hypothetical protein